MQFIPVSRPIYSILILFTNEIFTISIIIKFKHSMALKNVILLIFVTFGAILNQFAFGQNDPALSVSQVQKDFDFAVESLKSIHPSIYNFISPKEFQNSIDITKANLSSEMTESELHVILRKLIHKIGCGHTVARPSKSWYESIKSTSILPFRVYVHEKKIYIRESLLSASTLLPGMEILSIDGHTVDELLSELSSIQEKDGFNYTFVRSKIERLFQTYYLFLYGQQEEYHLEYVDLDGNIKNAKVKGGNERKNQNPKEKSTNYVNELKTDHAHFYILENDPKTAILTLNAFQQKGYKKFYKSVFSELNRKKVKNLVLDLRNNGGGYFPNGNHLLSYLVDEDFQMYFDRPKKKPIKSKHVKMDFMSKMTRFSFNMMPDKDKDDPRRNYSVKVKAKESELFKGKLFILLNGASFSLSSYTASMLKKYTDAVFIGEESGGTEYGSNALLDYKVTLPESKIIIIIPYYFLDHKMGSKKPGWGIFPDYPISYSLKEKMENRDKEMAKALSLIKND